MRYITRVLNFFSLRHTFLLPGLTADARVLSRFMRMECLNERYSHNRPLLLNKLMERVGSKMQTATQGYDKRPYGVGLILAGFDVSTYYLLLYCEKRDKEL